jgi:hypothetical protein
MNDTHEDWVLTEAAKRCGYDPDSSRSAWVSSRSFRALCDMIAKHETKPVDPDEEAVKRIFVAYWGNPMGGITHLPENLAAAVSQYKQEKGNG